jgi:GTP:adenosylcobinamide-phosphate guanylyltransferase
MSEERFRVIALAGGVLEPSFRRAGFAAVNKAYIAVDGQTMLARVLRALGAAASIREIRVITPPDAWAAAGRQIPAADAVIAPGSDLIGSVVAGLNGIADDERVLVCATDLPLLTPRAVDAFAAAARTTPCDVGYGYVERGAHQRAYPGIRHTWVRLREGTFCGGGISVLRAGATRRIVEALRRFTGARKAPWRMAALFSPMLMARLLLGKVSVRELEQRAGALTGLLCRGLLCPYPEIAVNVDRFSDLLAVEKILKG